MTMKLSVTNLRSLVATVLFALVLLIAVVCVDVVATRAWHLGTGSVHAAQSGLVVVPLTNETGGPMN